MFRSFVSCIAACCVALLLSLTGLVHAQHTSTACPPQTATVANGGSVEIDISDCDAYNFGFGNGVPPYAPAASPLSPLHGTVVLRQEGVPPTPPSTIWIARSILTYTHTNTSSPATQDVFQIEDLDVRTIRFTITIQPPTSAIVVSPATISLRTGQAFSQQLSATGGTAPYSFSLQSGTLPPGLSMTTPQGLISGTPTTRSNYNFTIRAQDSTGAFTLKTYSGVIDNPIFTLSPSPLTLLQGVPASMQFVAGGGTAPYTFPADVGVILPPGLSVSTSGLLTGTPNVLGTTSNARILVNDSTTDPACPGCDFFAFVTVPMTVTATLPVVSIAVSPGSVAEDDTSNLVFTVTRNVALASATVVNITTGGTAASGTDYTGGVTTVTIPAGATTATITINPAADTTVEPNETVILTVAAGSGYTVGSPASATGTISNDDVAPPNMTINDVTTNEGNAGITNFTFTVSLSAPAGPGGVTFDIATANGSATSGVDYVASSLTSQTIPAGSSTYTFTVLANGDTLNEPSETFFVNVTNVVNAVVIDGQGVGTIVNDDPLPSISTSNITVLEGNSSTTNAVVTVTLSAASGQSVTVNYQTGDGTATAPSDYTAIGSTVLTFTPGQTSRTIAVLVNGDIAPETNETFSVSLFSAVNATISVPTSFVTITNDDASIVLSPTSLPNVAFNAGYNQTITATGGSGSYSFAVTSGALPGGLSLSPGGTLTGTATAGGTFSFTVTATDTSPAPGPFTGSQLYSITVTPIAQTVSFAPTSPVAFGSAPITLTATASSGLTTFSFATTSASSICTVSGNQLTIVGAGTCALTTTQPGNANYNAASANANVVINPASQTVTFAPTSPIVFGAAPATLSATATSGLTTFNFTTSSASTICTVAGNTVTFVGAGVCNLTATQPGNANYQSASANASVTINPATQTVSFAPASPVVFGVAPITLSATATSGLTAFTFSTSSPNTVCTVAGNQLTITGVGVCNLTATQPGNTNYQTASSNASITVNPATQTVTFAPASPVVFGVAPVALTATATSGLTSFTFSTSSAATICTVSGNTVTFTGGGSCALTATQPGNANYQSASATATIVVNPATQTVTFTPATPVTFGTVPATLSATATSGLTSFTFSTGSPASVCTVSGTTLTYVGAGSCSLTATQAGSASYQSALATATVVITAANQTVTFAPASPVVFGVTPITLMATATSGLTTFTFSTSSANTICTVAGNQLTITGAGSCALTANQAGNANYQPASTNATVVVNPASQTVNFAPATPVTFGVSPITLSATASSGLTTFNFSTSSPNTVCTVSGNQLTIVGVGSCALTATQPGNANYQSANASATIGINPASQTVTFTPTTPVNFGTGPYTLMATATSGLTTFTFSTTAAATICTVSGNQLTIVGIGSCPLTAAQPGNANYQPASATATVTINAVVAGAPTIGAATPANGQANIAFTPPASDGGSPITSYTVTCNPGAVTASGAASPVTVTGLTNGSTYNCTVIANNVAGPSAPSASVAVTPRTVPDAPTIGAATLGVGQVTIAFTPSASDGGSPITGYTVRCVSALGTVTANGSGSPIVVTGLTNGMLYQCSVVANNLVGASPASAAVTVDLPALPVPLNVGLWLIALLMLAAAVGVQRRRFSER